MIFRNQYFNVDSITETGVFSGVASDASLNRNGYAYAPGAFNQSLADHKARGSMPALLMHHDTRQPVGRWLDIQPSAAGKLSVRGQIATDTTTGAEAYRLLKAGALPALSTGCLHEEEQSDRGGVLTITKADLLEISLVAVPANPGARVISVNEIQSPRDIEDMFFQAGMSGRKAKAMGAAAWRSIQSAEAGAEAALSTIIDQASTRLARFNRS